MAVNVMENNITRLPRTNPSLIIKVSQSSKNIGNNAITNCFIIHQFHC